MFKARFIIQNLSSQSYGEAGKPAVNIFQLYFLLIHLAALMVIICVSMRKLQTQLERFLKMRLSMYWL